MIRMRQSAMILSLVLVALVASAILAAAATITWTGAAGNGLWQTTGNWDLNRLPDNGDDVVIPNLAGTASVTHSSAVADTIGTLTCSEVLILSSGTIRIEGASASTNNFTLSGGTLAGAGSLAISGAFSWTLGAMSGTGTTTVASGVTWSWGGSTTTLTRTLINNGTCNRVGAFPASIDTPGLLRNQSGGTIDIQTPANINGTGSIENQAGAVFVKSAGGGGVNVVPPFTNAGTVNANNGILGFTAATNNASMTVASGATLQATSNFTSAAGSSMTVNGTFSVIGGTSTIDPSATFTCPGTVSITAGSLTMGPSVSIGTLTLDTNGGTLGGAGNILVTNAMSWGRGTMGGSGTTTVASGVTWSWGGASATTLTRSLINNGTCNRVGALPANINTPGILRNQSGGTIDIQTPANINGTGSIENQAGAVFVKSSGGGGVNVAPPFTNAGTVNANDGILGFTAATNNASMTVASGATLQATSNFTSAAGSSMTVNGTLSVIGGTSTIDPSATFTCPGTVSITAGSLTMGPNVSLGTLTLDTNGGTLGGAGNILVTNAMSWGRGTMGGAGTTTVGSGVTWSWGGASGATTLTRTLINNGTCNRVGAFQANINTPGLLRNQSGGTIDISVDRNYDGTGSIENQSGALLVKSAGAGSASIVPSFTNSGTVRVSSGTLFVSGTFANFASNTLTGGTYEVIGAILKFNNANIVTNAATVLLDGASSQIQNQSGVNGLANIETNAGGGIFTIKNGRSISATPLFSNAGVVTIGPGASTFTANAGYQQTAGHTRLDGGTLASSSLVDIQGGSLLGSGTVSGSVVNDGIVATGSSPGTITVNGDYTQGAAGRLEVELAGLTAGVEHDVLNVSGEAALDGELEVSLLDDFIPVTGNSFDVLTASSMNGVFASTNLPLAAGAGCLDVAYPSGAVRLEQLENVAISEQPSSQEVCLGSNVSFSVTATGSSPAYQWRKNGNDIPEATESTFSIPVAAESDAGSYDVVVSNACNTLTSDAAILDVDSGPTILEQPESQAVCEGTTVIFSVVVTETPAPTFQWRKDGSEIDGATSSTFTIPVAAQSDEGSYDVLIANVCGSIASDVAVLTVGEGIAIIDHPDDQTACLGETIAFSVSAIGPDLAFQWRKDTTEIPGATDSTLILALISDASEGAYDVLVTGSCGSLLSNAATLTTESCPDTLFVNAAAATDGDGQSWGTARKDLQPALVAAVAIGDIREIWVAAGTYKPATSNRNSSFVLGSKVALYGGFAGSETSRDQRDPDANQTILSGDLAGNDGPSFTNYEENSLHVVNGDGVDSTAVLDGCTIRGGNADQAGPGGAGGGLRIFSGGRPSIARCSFVANRAIAGGGIIISGDGEVQIRDCTFSENGGEAIRMGGNASGTMSNCVFARNSGIGAGALNSFAASPVLIDCTFNENSATTGAGAISCTSGTLMIAVGCTFTGNESDTNGGAISANGTALTTLVNCQFSGSQATGSGGAIHLASSGNTGILNCTLSGNSAESSGGGIALLSNSGVVTVANSVLWGNLVGTSTEEAAQLFASGSVAPVVNFCDIQGLTGGFGGNGNVGLDPLFVDADGADDTIGTLDDDLTVQPFSPVIDAASNNAVPAEITTDLAGLPRFFDDPCVTDTGQGPAPIVDMGAHEFPTASCPTNVEGEATTRALQFSVGPVAPNPSSERATLVFVLPSPSHVVAEILDVSGRQIAVLSDQSMPAGEHRLAWGGFDRAGRRVAAGIYFLQLEAGDRSITRKLVRRR